MSLLAWIVVGGVLMTAISLVGSLGFTTFLVVEQVLHYHTTAICRPAIVGGR